MDLGSARLRRPPPWPLLVFSVLPFAHNYSTVNIFSCYRYMPWDVLEV